MYVQAKSTYRQYLVLLMVRLALDLAQPSSDFQPTHRSRVKGRMAPQSLAALPRFGEAAGLQSSSKAPYIQQQTSYDHILYRCIP
ncbi:hypothetical protein J6590_101494 [Homalodisca vitripennis]|nr:hypothetical protein J6590_101494 [Homalodisca vitripennis]